MIQPDRWRFLAVTSAIALVATVVSLWLVYATARDQQLDDMGRAAETLAALMESVARFDARFSAQTHPEGSRGATLSQIEQGLADYIGRRGGEELVLGQRIGKRLQVLRATPHRGFEVAAEPDFDGYRGRPLYEALEGRRGKGRFLDYRGVPVLAAYAPVPTLRIGIVYKIDASAFNAPFLRAGAWAGAIYLGLVAALVTVYRRSTRRLAQRLDVGETRYRRLHESMTDAFVQVTMDGRIVECNRAYQEMLGYADDELRRLTYVDLTPERWHDFEARLVRDQILPRGHSDVYEKEYRRKDGTVLPVELRTFLLRDAAGAPAGMWAIVRDITERRKAELELAEKEAQLRAIVEGAFDGILMADVETRKFSFGNAAICRMLGVTPQQLLTLGLEDIHPPQTLDELGRQFEVMGRGETTVVRSTPLLRRDGEIRLVDISGSAILVGDRRFNVGVFRDITERRRAERALEESRRRLDFLLATSPAIIYSARAAGDFAATFVSPNVTDQLGYAPDEFTSRPDFWADNIHPDDSKVILSGLESIFQHNSHVHEYRFRHKNGHYVWMRDDAILIRDEAGHPLKIVGSWIDITERKQAQRALRDAEARYRLLFEQSPYGVVLIDMETGNTLEANAVASEQLGYTNEEIVALSISDYEAIERPEETLEHLQRVRRQGSDEFETLHRTRNGELRNVHVWVKAIRLGEQSLAYAIFQDVTERKRGEEALRASEARLTEAQRIGKMGSWEWDVQNDVSTVSKTLLWVFGLENEAQIRDYEEFAEYIHPDDARGVREAVNRALSGESEYNIDYRIVRPDGQVRFANSQAVVVRDANNVPIRMAGTMQDITERKRAEEEMQIRGSAMASAISGIAMSDMDGRINYVNPAWLKMHGYESPDEVMGTTPLDHVQNPADAMAIIGSIKAENRWTGELMCRRRDGSCFPAELISNVVTDSAGRLICLLASFQDITERTRQTALLRTSEARLNEAQRIARLGSWELDLVENRLHWSDEVFRLFEIDPARFGASYEAFLEAIHPDDREAVDAAYHRSLRDRQPYHITHRLLMADGRVKHVEEQCETDFAPDGTPLCSRGTVQDVTERVLAEERLRGALREKTTLLQEIHHRVKNNLQVVSSLLFFEQRATDDAGMAAGFQRSRDRVAAIAEVHESLYQTTDLAHIPFEPYVAALARRVMRHLSGQTGPVALRVEGGGFDLDVVSAVPCALIVNELLTNALKHAFPHGRGGTITLRLEIAPDGARHLWFADDGVGTPVPASAPSTLGLKLVDSLVGQVQGTLIREPAAVGTCYHLTIPPEVPAR